MGWIAYNDLAWVDKILSDVDDYKEESNYYIGLIKDNTSVPVPKVLHFGCGAGNHDYFFKKHFQITGIDISHGMLEIARNLNPETNYLLGDMRTIELDEKFDVVIIPDSIDYINTYDDLSKTIANSCKHLKDNGILFIVAHVKEEFRNNNFVYSGEKDNINVTLFENNYITSENSYEATLFYIIREVVRTYHYQEVHKLGLFKYKQWIDLFTENKLKVKVLNYDHSYDQYLLGEGEYKQKIFINQL